MLNVKIELSIKYYSTEIVLTQAMAGETLNTEVLIIGGGPVGMSLAADLNYRGVKCILVEKKMDTTKIPKATLVNVRSMEHFRRLEIAEVLKDKTTFPRDVPVNMVMGTGVLKSKQVTSFCYGSWGEAVDGVAKHYAYYNLGCSAELSIMCPQLILEPILKEHLDTVPNVTSYWGWSLVGLRQDMADDGMVTANVENPAGAKLTINARFAVGCDGGSSYTRKLIGVHTYGQFVLHKAVSVYFESKELRTIIDNKPGVYMVNNRRISGILVTVDINKGRFMIYSLLPFDSAKLAQALLDNPKKFVNDFVGKEIEHNVIINSSWETHAVLATKYREGHVFLCGDAAHQWVPVGGIGMNTGIADAMDLSWKIDAILKGWGGYYLFDSYLLERRPLADKTRSFVLDTGEIVGTVLSRRLGPLLSIIPGISTLFGRYLVKSVRDNFKSGTNIVLGFQYSNSNIIVHPKDSSQHRDAINVLTPFLPRAVPGRRAPHVVLENLPTIHDLFGRDYTLLIIDGSTSDCRDLQDEAARRKMPLEVHKVKGRPQVVVIYSNHYYLVRPDGVIAWCSDFQPNKQDAAHIISVICGDFRPRYLPTQNISRSVRPVYKFPPIFEIACIGYLTFLLQHHTPLSLHFSYLLGLNAMETMRLCLAVKKKKKSAYVSRHKASVLCSYGLPSISLKLDEKHVSRYGPNDVLIKVHAASVNRIDVGMTMGYGSKMVSASFQGPSLPRVLGRDCAGEVVAVGDEVKKFIAADLVYTTCPWSRDGSHAQYVAVDEKYVAHKPRNLSYIEAASLPWVTTTVWTALVDCAGLNWYNTRNKRVLVHGGSGGVGSFAIQLLKAWGAEVVTTCSTDNVQRVKNLGADTVIDYTKEDFTTLAQDFDIVFDTVGYTQNYEVYSLRLLKRFKHAKYLSIRSPLLRQINRWGVVLGNLITQVITGIQVITQRLLHGRGFYYVVAQPNGECLEEVGKLVEVGKIIPQLSPAGTFPLEKISEAYELVRQGHAGGKVIITFT